MRARIITVVGLLGFLVAAIATVVDAQVAPQGARTSASYSAPRTPWGDPDLQGAYTNSDESQTPLERPDSLAGRTLADITPEELARINEERNQQRVEADKQRWELRSPLHWFENHNFRNSRAWLVVDPPDGKVPPYTEAAQKQADAFLARNKDVSEGRGRQQ
jgi:hypothetical protein